jgi:hypothetical protein
MPKKPKNALSLAPLAAAVADAGIAWASKASTELAVIPETEAPPSVVSAGTLSLLKELQSHVASNRTDINGKPVTDWAPLKNLALIATDPNVDAAVRARCLSEIASYIYPRLRGIEIASKHDETINVNIRTF